MNYVSATDDWEFYLDGVKLTALVSESGTTGADWTNCNMVEIGQTTINATRLYPGAIRRLSGYDAPLTAPEVSAFHNHLNAFIA
jgi:hypothetical protein